MTNPPKYTHHDPYIDPEYSAVDPKLFFDEAASIASCVVIFGHDDGDPHYIPERPWS